MARKPRKTTLRALVKKQGESNFLLVAQKTVLTRQKKPLIQMAWVVKSDFKLNPDPTVIVERFSDYWLAAHREAILAGVKADGSGKQPDFDGSNRGGAWRRSKAGQRPDVRGKISGTFADNLVRGKITIRKAKSTFNKTPPFGPKPKGGGRQKAADAIEAKATISAVSVPSRASLPDATKGPNKGEYVAFVSKESDRGVDYHYTEGDIEAGLSVILDQVLEAIVEGDAWDEIKGDSEERSKRAKF